MAKRQRGLAGLERLPQRFDVWQADARQMPEVSIGGVPTQPWLTVVVSATEGMVLCSTVSEEQPTVTEIWGVLSQAMREPVGGEPHRPTEVQFAEQELADRLRPQLAGIDVQCTVAEELEEVDHILAYLADKVGGQEPSPGLLDVEGMTPEGVGSFFDAAALFHEQAPWKKVGERPIRIECARFGGGPWYAVLMGQAGMTSGLALYDDLETLGRIQDGNMAPQEMAEMTAGLAVVFGSPEDGAPEDVEAAAQHGWRVAGPEAYPSAYRTDPGLQMRPPTVEELSLLEACLRAVPEFVRKKSRRIEPTFIKVPTAAGEAEVGLSWAEW